MHGQSRNLVECLLHCPFRDAKTRLTVRLMWVSRPCGQNWPAASLPMRMYAWGLVRQSTAGEET